MSALLDFDRLSRYFGFLAVCGSMGGMAVAGSRKGSHPSFELGNVILELAHVLDRALEDLSAGSALRQGGRCEGPAWTHLKLELARLA